MLYREGCSLKKIKVHSKKEVLDQFAKGTGIEGQGCHKFHNYETAYYFIVSINDTYVWMMENKFSIADDWMPKVDWNEVMYSDSSYSSDGSESWVPLDNENDNDDESDDDSDYYIEEE